MTVFFASIFVLGLAYFLGRYIVQANPKMLADNIRQIIGILLCVGAAVSLFSGRFALLALPLGFLGGAVLLRGSFPSFGSKAGGKGQSSRVKTAFFDMYLDHASGAMDGTVRKGAFVGQGLSSLSNANLQSLYEDVFQDVTNDADSLSLIETYLDSVLSSWREDFHVHDHAGHGGASRSGPVSKQEAYEILGLSSGASVSEIRAAHRRLMMKAHPDRGGSTFLASKINEAKDILMGNHTSTS